MQRGTHRAIVRGGAIHPKADARPGPPQGLERCDAGGETHIGARAMRDAGLGVPQPRDFVRARMDHVGVPDIWADPTQVLG